MAKYRKLGRTASQRKALLRNQVTALLNNGKIVTTEAKAKEIRKQAESLIALAVKEKDNFEEVTVMAKVARKDADGKRVKEFRGTTRCSQKFCAAFGPVTAAMPARPSREDPFRRQLPRESPKSPPTDGSQPPVLSAAGLGNLDHSSLGNQDSSFLAFPDIRCILAQNPPFGNSFFGKKPFPQGERLL